MGLFGSYASVDERPKKRKSLMEMVKEEFSDDLPLQTALGEYLSMRKKDGFLPSSKSWEVQLKLLKSVVDFRRVPQVVKATKRGWMAVAYENKIDYTSSSRNVGNIVQEAF